MKHLDAELVLPKLSENQLLSTLTRRHQQFIILPTEKCNFRCTYCYEDFKIGKMSEETQSALEKIMSIRIPELDDMAISWFGGEPLAAQEVVLRIASHAARLCAEHDVNFSGGLTTNAYRLNFELFEELVSYKQNFFQITLDGFGQTHDEVRKLANGRGSFERIWSNLIATKSSTQHFRILIRIHVRRENVESLDELMAELGKQFGDDNRYELDFEHLRNLGGEGGLTVKNPISIEEVREIEPRLRSIYKSHSSEAVPEVNSQKATPIITAQISEKKNIGAVVEPYICYAAKANSLLIRADGRIGKCTVALDDDRNTIGQLKADGTIEIDSDKLKPWIRGLSSGSLQELECPLANLPVV